LGGSDEALIKDGKRLHIFVLLYVLKIWEKWVFVYRHKLKRQAWHVSTPFDKDSFSQK